MTGELRPEHGDLASDIGKYFRGKVVFLGVGNILRGDDAIGPELVERLSVIGMPAVDAGTVPENCVGVVKRMNPDTVVIVDAVHLGREPGSVEILGKEDIASGNGFTTHSLSPALVMERIERETDAPVFLLAVQPSNLEFAAPLSPEVQNVLEYLPELLYSVITGLHRSEMH